jgi:hypothetical protein
VHLAVCGWLASTVYDMTPEQAAQLLDKELRRYPWYIAVGVGNADDGHPALFLYVKSGKHRKLNEVSQGWRGFEVIVEVTGAMRPLARKRA